MKRVLSGTAAGNRGEERRVSTRKRTMRYGQDCRAEIRGTLLHTRTRTYIHTHTHTHTHTGTYVHIYRSVLYTHGQEEAKKRRSRARGSWKRDAIGARRRGADRRGGTGRVTSMTATRRNPTPSSAFRGLLTRRAHRQRSSETVPVIEASLNCRHRRPPCDFFLDRRLVPPPLPLSSNLVFRSRGRPPSSPPSS